MHNVFRLFDSFNEYENFLWQKETHKSVSKNRDHFSREVMLETTQLETENNAVKHYKNAHSIPKHERFQ